MKSNLTRTDVASAAGITPAAVWGLVRHGHLVPSLKRKGRNGDIYGWSAVLAIRVCRALASKDVNASSTQKLMHYLSGMGDGQIDQAVRENKAWLLCVGGAVISQLTVEDAWKKHLPGIKLLGLRVDAVSIAPVWELLKQQAAARAALAEVVAS